MAFGYTGLGGLASPDEFSEKAIRSSLNLADVASADLLEQVDLTQYGSASGGREAWVEGITRARQYCLSNPGLLAGIVTGSLYLQVHQEMQTSGVLQLNATITPVAGGAGWQCRLNMARFGNSLNDLFIGLGLLRDYHLDRRDGFDNAV